MPRSCFSPRIYTVCFLILNFNSQLPLHDHKVFGEALLSRPMWIKSPVSHSTVHPKIVLFLELFCLSIKKEMLKFRATGWFIYSSIPEPPTNAPPWIRHFARWLNESFYWVEGWTSLLTYFPDWPLCWWFIHVNADGKFMLNIGIQRFSLPSFHSSSQHFFSHQGTEHALVSRV